MDNVVIKIFDSVNNLDFEIPLSSDSDSRFTLSKSISDLTDLTSRSGVQSRNFKITLSKDIADTYDFFNQAMHHNYKDVDADKEAVILINGNELERGKIRIVNYTNTNNEEEVELLFFGNNYDWKEEIKDLTSADLTWTNNAIIYTPATIKGSWSNNVNDGHEWVFPLENRGGRKLISMVHTEDFRPAIFLYQYLKRAFFSIGYTFESNFFETDAFKSLVLTFFGTRFRNTKEVINLNKVNLSFVNEFDINESNYHGNETTALLTSDNDSTDWAAWTENLDTNNNFRPTQGYSVNNRISGQFIAPQSGQYQFNMVLDLKIITNISSGSGVDRTIRYSFFVRKYDIAGGVIQSIAGLEMDNVFDNSLNNTSEVVSLNETRTLIGSVEVLLKQGERAEIWGMFRTIAGTSNTFFNYSNAKLDINLLPPISEGNPFNLTDVLDDKVKVIDIINDVSRMFNLFWDADTILKKITVEPRDDYYNAISTAYDVTEQIDNSREIKIIYNSSFHKKNLVFKYTDDNKDVFVEGRDKEKSTNLAEYKHTLPNKFQKGTTIITTSFLAATYVIIDVDSVDFFQPDKAPYTSMYWNTFTETTPLEILEDHAPRILCYQFGIQNGTRFDTVNANKFRFYDEQNDRTTIPFVLPYQIKIDGTVIASTEMNLYWHSINDQNGLFTNYWSKTITEIVSGLKASLRMWFDQKQWKDFSFRKIAYINEPIDLKGYWIFEKKDNFQPEEGGLVNVELLKRIEYEPQVEGTTVIELTPIKGNLRVTGGNETAMTVFIEDANGNEASVNMQSENNEPLI